MSNRSDRRRRQAFIARRDRKAKLGSSLDRHGMGWGAWTRFVPSTDFDFDWATDVVQAWRNRVYVVQHVPRKTDWGLVDHLMIQRCDAKRGFPWPHGQRIKNELMSPDRTAVEVYPPDDAVIDDYHVYHLWLLPSGMSLPFDLGDHLE